MGFRRNRYFVSTGEITQGLLMKGVLKPSLWLDHIDPLSSSTQMSQLFGIFLKACLTPSECLS